MAALDWIALAVVVASSLVGAWRGLIFEVLSLAGWVLAFVAAYWWATDLAALLEPRVPGDAHARERRHLLAAQARRAPPPAAGQAHVRGASRSRWVRRKAESSVRVRSSDLDAMPRRLAYCCQ